MEQGEDLRPVGLFAGFTGDELAAVKAQATRLQVDKGHVFFRHGEVNRSIYVVARGQIQIERPGTEGKVLLADLGAGRSFGEMSFLDGSRATASVTARDAVVAYGVSHAMLESLLAERPALMAKFWRNLALDLKARLVETNALVEDYADVQQVLIGNPELRESYLRG